MVPMLLSSPKRSYDSFVAKPSKELQYDSKGIEMSTLYEEKYISEWSKEMRNIDNFQIFP